MYIFDFDDTLFNTRGEGGFKEARLNALKDVGVSEEVYIETYLEARNLPDGRCMYSSERHAAALVQRGFGREEILSALNKTTENLKIFLLPGAVEFLEELKESGEPMILLSLGDAEFQFMKVRGCDIEKYFDRIFMTPQKNVEVLSEILEKVSGDNVWFFNDKVEETKFLHAAHPHMKVALKISESIPLSEYENSELPYFKTLKEIRDYVIKSR